ncbi:cyclic-phosphate processing receiver domain-containing protein [Hominenteromicrobium sp.]|uniref:cyclic-phosphate processing receiver domain-containing protein n=1 Tax=Hominenteromicrobium sp. TaxID=3073581 RepID=UPI003999E896
MKIWLDDMRPAPEGFVWCRSVNEAKRLIHRAIEPIPLVDCDHDLATTPAMAAMGSNFWTGWQKPGNFCLSVFTQ